MAKKSETLGENTGHDDPVFTITEDMQTYIEMKKVSGVPTLLETDLQKHEFTKEYNAWVKAGRPKPQLPHLMIEEDPIPLKLYRKKHLGIQKLFWRDTKGKLHGKEVIVTPITRKGKDAFTGEETTIVEGERKQTNYTLNYTKEIGEKLVEDAEARCIHPTYYILDGDTKFSIKARDFNRDLDELIMLCREHKYVF